MIEDESNRRFEDMECILYQFNVLLLYASARAVDELIYIP